MENFVVFGGFGHQKTNPISVSPQHCWGFENQFEKTKPKPAFGRKS
jgi:hypothetical protein